MTRIVSSLLLLTLAALCGCDGGRGVNRSNECIILVGHGAFPSDYPKDRLDEWFRMSVQQHSADADEHHDAGSEHAQRTREILNWPRTPENDPYKFAVDSLAERLRERTGRPVLVAFHELCAPSIGAAIDEAVRQGARTVILTTTMITPGGAHSEVDIPTSIEVAGRRHPNVRLIYAWPYDPDRLAAFFADQIERFAPPEW